MSKPGCHSASLYNLGLASRDKINLNNQPIQLKKLVVTEIKNNYFRAHFMTRKNEGETWSTAWKVEGNADIMRQSIIKINFL